MTKMAKKYSSQEREMFNLEEKLKPMHKAVDKLINFLDHKAKIEFSSEEYMSLYTNMYDLCTMKANYSPEIYARYQWFFRDYIHYTVLPSLMEKEDKASLLKEIAERWSNHRLMIKWLSRFFNYLDRYHTTRSQNPCLNDAGVICFRESVYEKMHVRAKDGALQLINRERDGEPIDRSLLNNIVDFFIAIGLGDMNYYTDKLEEPILQSTADYYSRLAMEHIRVDSCTEYMIMAEEKLKLEEERAVKCLHADTRPKLLKEIRDKLLKNVEVQLLEKEHSGLRVLLREDKFEDLKRMYRLFCHVDRGLETITPIFTQNMVDDGLELIKQAQDTFGKKVDNKDSAGSQEAAFVKKVLDLHEKQLGYVTTCFKDNSQFHKALKQGFETICNKTIAGTDMADLLSNYTDNILKKGGGFEKSSDEMIEDALDKAAKLLDYIDNKDLFAEFSRKKLGRRLLYDRSANDEHERYLLSRLKQNNGGQFTSKMEGMMRDLQVAKDLQTEFMDFQADDCSSQNPGIDLVVSVLTTGFWPTYKTYDLHLPSEMTKSVEAFKTFYKVKNKTRKLTWVLSMGTCLLTGKFVPKSIELLVTTPQAATLMLFNDSDKLSFKEIMEQLNLQQDDVTRLLHSLSCTKYKILCKEPNTRSIGKDDIFTFNLMFTDRSRRVKVPLPPTDEKKKVFEDVDKDRKYTIDATIVRIMKSRKVIGYQELLIESVRQLNHRFKPDVKIIKRRIEDLIERGYMERDEEDQNKFKYIA